MTLEQQRTLLADELLIIERELRLLGWWQSKSPSVDALGSGQPFCVDTLAFEQWLQWVMLPRFKALIEAGEHLPVRSGILPMAEEVYGRQSRAVGPLLAALGRLDRLIERG